MSDTKSYVEKVSSYTACFLKDSKEQPDQFEINISFKSDFVRQPNSVSSYRQSINVLDELLHVIL